MRFEARVEALRKDLRCSYRSAWFRGHEDAAWHLTPSAFRSRVPVGISDLTSDFPAHNPCDTDLRRPARLRLDDPLSADACNVLEADTRAEIAEISRQVERSLSRIQKVDDEIREVARSAAALTGVVSASVPRDLAQSRRGIRTTLERSRSEHVSHLAQLRRQILTLRCLRYGEKDAFVFFRSRTNMEFGVSSWETLAGMQHYGAPTRMLDWTDTLAVAIYFGTKAYRDAMVASAGSIPNWLEAHSDALSLRDFRSLPTPEIWILNPFHLARLALGQNRIEDLTLLPELDYFKCFHQDHSWPYSRPIPITLPWRTPRLIAQRGYFTVHGLDCRSIDEQLANRTIRVGEPRRNAVVGRITLDPLTAVYGVRHIVQFVGLDAFSLFRDEDNLGMALRELMMGR